LHDFLVFVHSFFVYLNKHLLFQSTMRTIMYTERENLHIYNPNSFFPLKRPVSYYSPDLFESVCAWKICPGEHILVSIEDNDILYTYNGQCCCGGCVSKTSNLMLTFEVINFHTKEIVHMPKKSSLTTLLTHEFIKHKLCIASMNEICVNRYFSGNDTDDNDDNNEIDVTVLGNWSTQYDARQPLSPQPLSPRSFLCTQSLPSSPHHSPLSLRRLPLPPLLPSQLTCATSNNQQAVRSLTATPVTWAEPLLKVHYIE